MSLMELKLKSKSANENEITLMCTKCFNLIRVPKMAVSVKMEYDTSDHNTTGISATKGDLLISPRRMIDYLELRHDCHISIDDTTPGKLVMIDNGIADAVKLFNKKGYITAKCCEGHNDMLPGGNSYYMYAPYISFNITDSKHDQEVYKAPIDKALNDMKSEYEDSIILGEAGAEGKSTYNPYYESLSSCRRMVRALERIETRYVEDPYTNEKHLVIRYNTVDLHKLESGCCGRFCDIMYDVAMRISMVEEEK